MCLSWVFIISNHTVQDLKTNGSGKRYWWWCGGGVVVVVVVIGGGGGEKAATQFGNWSVRF